MRAHTLVLSDVRNVNYICHKVKKANPISLDFSELFFFSKPHISPIPSIKRWSLAIIPSVTYPLGISALPGLAVFRTSNLHGYATLQCSAVLHCSAILSFRNLGDLGALILGVAVWIPLRMEGCIAFYLVCNILAKPCNIATVCNILQHFVEKCFLWFSGLANPFLVLFGHSLLCISIFAL